MKITVEVVPTPKPPRQITLVLSEGEAALIQEFSRYYAFQRTEGDRRAAAARLRDILKKENLVMSPYLYDDCFNDKS